MQSIALENRLHLVLSEWPASGCKRCLRGGFDQSSHNAFPRHHRKGAPVDRSPNDCLHIRPFPIFANLNADACSSFSLLVPVHFFILSKVTSTTHSSGKISLLRVREEASFSLAHSRTRSTATLAHFKTSRRNSMCRRLRSRALDGAGSATTARRRSLSLCPLPTRTHYFVSRFVFLIYLLHITG
jgi:hypothetical protein